MHTKHITQYISKYTYVYYISHSPTYIFFFCLFFSLRIFKTRNRIWNSLQNTLLIIIPNQGKNYTEKINTADCSTAALEYSSPVVMQYLSTAIQQAYSKLFLQYSSPGVYQSCSTSVQESCSTSFLQFSVLQYISTVVLQYFIPAVRSPLV